jgi:hypothetical protein
MFRDLTEFFNKFLEKKYGTRLWHGLTRNASFIEAGFDFDVYDIFYRPTSEMTHAEPSRYVMRDPDDAWVFGWSDLKELRYLAGAYVSSYELLLVGMEQINRVLSLPFGNRLAACKKSLFGFAPKYEEALLSVKDGEGGIQQVGDRLPPVTAMSGLPRYAGGSHPPSLQSKNV